MLIRPKLALRKFRVIRRKQMTLGKFGRNLGLGTLVLAWVLSGILLAPLGHAADCANYLQQNDYQRAPHLTYAEVGQILRQNFPGPNLRYFQEVAGEIQQAASQAASADYWPSYFGQKFAAIQNIPSLNLLWGQELYLRHLYRQPKNSALREFWGKEFTQSLTSRHIAFYEAYLRRLYALLTTEGNAAALQAACGGKWHLVRITAPTGQKYLGLQMVLTAGDPYDAVAARALAQRPGMAASAHLLNMIYGHWQASQMPTTAKYYVRYFDQAMPELLAQGDFTAATVSVGAMANAAIDFARDLQQNHVIFVLPWMQFSQEVRSVVANFHEIVHYQTWHLLAQWEFAPNSPLTWPGGMKSLSLSEITAYAREYDFWQQLRADNQAAHPGTDASWMAENEDILSGWRQLMAVLVPRLESELQGLAQVLAQDGGYELAWEKQGLGPMVQNLTSAPAAQRWWVTVTYTSPVSGQKLSFKQPYYDELDLSPTALAEVFRERLRQEVAVDIGQAQKLKARWEEAMAIH